METLSDRETAMALLNSVLSQIAITVRSGRAVPPEMLGRWLRSLTEARDLLEEEVD